MSHDLDDLRVKITPRTRRHMEAEKRLYGREKSEIARRILDEHYERIERIASEARRIEENEGASGSLGADRGRGRK